MGSERQVKERSNMSFWETIQKFNGKVNMVHPELALKANRLRPIFQAFYNTTEKMKMKFVTSKTINNFSLIYRLLSEGKSSFWTLPSSPIPRNLKLMPLPTVFGDRFIFPENPNLLKKTHKSSRLKFEELFYIQLKILSLKHKRSCVFKGFVSFRRLAITLILFQSLPSVWTY